jgi:hypothetical protein
MLRRRGRDKRGRDHYLWLGYLGAECDYVIRFQPDADFLAYGMIMMAGHER